jgi:large subunit ribosomal protein L9
MKRSHRHVSVILNKDLEGIGFAGELLSARAGFARNFLLNDGRAEVATPAKIKQREAELAKAKQRREEEVTTRTALAEKIAATPMETTLKTGQNNRVFGSITAVDVTKKLKADHGLDIDKSHLHGLPIKQLGSTPVSVKLGLGVTATLNVVVTGQQAATEESATE